MRFLKLNKVTTAGRYDYDDQGEQREETLSPVVINAEAIKSFYPRKFGRPGTRINFTIGNGFAVSERFEHVQDLLEVLDAKLVGTHASAEVVELTSKQ